jgi:ribosomal protein S18 acetylase RimI-like enzyme
VTDLCRRVTDFFELVQREPASESSVTEILEVGPPGIDASKKVVLGFRRGDALIGIVDLIDGYPTQGTWYVGLFVLEPDERGRGLGRTIWAELEGWIRKNSGHTVRLVVQKQNVRARAFWEACGFAIDGEVEQVLPNTTNQVWRLGKQVEPGSAAQRALRRTAGDDLKGC